MDMKKLRSEKGMATVEFTVLLLGVVLLMFVTIDFGSLLHAQAVVTNVTREGGSLASRDLKSGADLMNFLASSSAPLDFDENPERFKIFIAKVDAGESAQDPNPTCTVVQPDPLETGGTLSGSAVESPASSPTCDLTQTLYDYLVFDDAIGTSPISQFTVVKVYYKYVPLTPMEALFQASGDTVLNFDSDNNGVNDSMLLKSKAVF